jgi:hypothetical protein
MSVRTAAMTARQYEHQWARELDKATRNHALWAAGNRGQIERWRETLALSGSPSPPD